MRKLILPVGLFAVALTAVIFFWRMAGQAEADRPGKMSYPAPEFAQGTQWLQSKSLTVASLRGQVVIVHFWTFGCINCIHNYPAYKSWQEKYAGKGVTIIGVHTPEFQGEADVQQIRAKAAQHGLTFPIAVDNDSRNWKNWKNRYWPSVYLQCCGRCPEAAS
jgi:thiol-disulfide isomerase/thioredoxin